MRTNWRWANGDGKNGRKYVIKSWVYCASRVEGWEILKDAVMATSVEFFLLVKLKQLLRWEEGCRHLVNAPTNLAILFEQLSPPLRTPTHVSRVETDPVGDVPFPISTLLKDDNVSVIKVIAAVARAVMIISSVWLLLPRQVRRYYVTVPKWYAYVHILSHEIDSMKPFIRGAVINWCALNNKSKATAEV